MAKEIKAKIKMRLQGGAATPAPPVGSNLGQHQVNIMDFCKKFNAETASLKGQTVPVVVTVYKDKSFDFIIKTTPVSDLLKKEANITKGSAKPNEKKVGKVTSEAIEKIAKIKMSDLNAYTLEQAKKIIAGSARSMGIVVEE